MSQRLKDVSFSATMTSFPYFSNEGRQGRRHALAIKYRPQPHTAIFSMQGSTFKVARWPVTTTSLCRAYTDAGPNEPLQISSIIMMKSTSFFVVAFLKICHFQNFEFRRHIGRLVSASASQ